MGLSVEAVRKPPKPIPEKVAKVWAEEGKKVYWQRLMPPRGYVALPRRWLVGGADFLLVGSEQEDEQGLREAARQRRSVRVRDDHSSNVGEAGTWLRISKRFRKGCFWDVALRRFQEVRARGEVGKWGAYLERTLLSTPPMARLLPRTRRGPFWRPTTYPPGISRSFGPTHGRRRREVLRSSLLAVG
jgi:hypothetical protein